MGHRRKRSPILGEAFDTRSMGGEDIIRAYINELEHYRPRGFRALANPGDDMASALERGDLHLLDGLDAWKERVCGVLTEWARRVDRHDFIAFGPLGRTTLVGFWIDVPAAQDEADIRLPAGDSVPRGFSGMAVFVNDHGNVDALNYSRGRATRTLFSLV